MGALASKSSANTRIHICHACTISKSINRTIIRLLDAVGSVRKNPILSLLLRLTRVYRLWSPGTENNFSTSPSPDLPTDATPREHVPFWEGPAPEEGTPQLSGEPSRRRGSAHTSPEQRGLRPPARGAPPRRARGVSCPGATNLAGIRDLVPGSSVGIYSFRRPLSVG